MMRRRLFRDQDGQIFIWLAASLAMLILFAALSIDMGMIYMTKARLSNAVDSAVLTAAKNASQGETTAKNLGSDMFAANMGTACGTNGITCTWTYCPGDSGCVANTGITATLTATTPYNTNFMEYFPQFAQWTLGDSGQATRSTLVMTIVLDRSGSMCGGTAPYCSGATCSNGDDGGEALESAVPTFVSYFSQGTDYLGLVSFASSARIDADISTEFQSPIDTAISGMVFCGGTFGTGAGSGSIYSTTNGPPMSMADAQNNSVTLSAGVPEVKVMVYFTDGLMNTIQDEFDCPGETLFNYGGYDTGTSIASLNPTNESDDLDPYCYDGGGSCNGKTNAGLPYYNSPGTVCSPTITTFHSEQAGGEQVALTRVNVTTEAQYRAIYTANQMRGETIPTYVYTIGLGNDVTGNGCVEAFLATLANDPAAATYSGSGCTGPSPGVYNSSLPAGQFFPVPDCPGASCTAELTQAFQVIYAKVALRLSE